MLCHQDHCTSSHTLEEVFILSPSHECCCLDYSILPQLPQDWSQTTDDIITTSEVARAKTRILLLSLQESFEDVLEALQHRQPLSKGHTLARLLLVKDEDGLLHVSSRVRDPASPKNPKRLIVVDPVGSHSPSDQDTPHNVWPSRHHCDDIHPL